jgi:hypothetical protein
MYKIFYVIHDSVVLCNNANFHSGPLSKYLTVLSNASNTPSLQLTITATIKPIIDVSEQFITLTSQKPVTLVLACEKKDLRITEVLMNAQPVGAPTGPAWQTKTPISIPFKWLVTDSTRADALRIFKLDLSAPTVAERLTGQFVIKTNHHDKPEISLTGTVEK